MADLAELGPLLEFSGPLLRELAKDTVLETVVEDVLFFGEGLADLAEENPELATLAAVALGVLIVAVGPEALAAGGVAIAEEFAPVLVRAIGSKWAGAVIQGFGSVVLSSSVGSVYASAVNLLNTALAKAGALVRTAGSSPDSTLPPNFVLTPGDLSAGQNFITSYRNPDGTFHAAVWNFSESTPGADPGRLDLSLNDGNENVTLLKGTWSKLEYNSQTGNLSIYVTASGGLEGRGFPTGRLNFKTSTNALTFTADNGTSFNLNGVDQLEVSLTDAGATKLTFGDPNSPNTEQLVVDASYDGKNYGETIDSNIGDLKLHLGTGSDTLLHLGAGSVIDTESGKSFSVSDGSLVLGANGKQTIPLGASDFIQTPAGGRSLDGTAGDTELVIANGDNQKATADRANGILIGAGMSDTLVASADHVKLIALGGGNNVLIGGSGDAFEGGSSNDLFKVTDNVLSSPTTFYFGADSGHDVIENAELKYDVFGGPPPDAPDSTKALQNYVINFGSLSPSDLTFVGIDDRFWYNATSGLSADGFRLGYVQVKSTGATLVLPDGRVGSNADSFGFASSTVHFDLPDSFKFVFDNGTVVYSGNEIISELYENFKSSSDVTFGVDEISSISPYLPPNDNILDPGFNNLVKAPWSPFLNGAGGDAGGFLPAPLADLAPLLGDAATDPLVDGSSGGLIITGQPDEITTATYADAASGVTVDLSNGMSSGDGVSGDVLINVQNVIGSAFDDTLIGDGGSTGAANVLDGGAGNDTLIALGSGPEGASEGTVTLIGGAGNNVLIGTGANTTADYIGASSAVTVDLGIGGATNNGYGGTDTLVGISAVLASGAGDTLIGGSAADTLIDSGDGDLLRAGSGPAVLEAFGLDNTLIGGTGADTFVVTGGGNTLIGGSGTTIVDYANAAGAVTVDLLAGIASSSSFVSSDTLSGVTGVIAAGIGDTLIGGSGAETLIDGGGSDLLEAGSGNALLEAFGSGNTLLGGSGNDTFVVGGGGNTIDGGGGANRIDYSNAATGVTVDLSAGVVLSVGFSGNDTFSDISDVVGSAYADTLIGGSGNDVLVGGGGDDTLIGGSGSNTLDGTGGVATADYAGVTGSVVADLSAGVASSNGYGGTDVLTAISNLTGSAYGDTLIGDGGAASGSNVLDGGAGNDTLIAMGSGSLAVSGGQVTLIGGSGDNTLIGTGAATTADYAEATGSVIADLSTGLASSNGYGGTDVLTSITDLVGSANGDTLIGDGAGNVLDGGSGNDTLIAVGSGSLAVSGGTVTLIGGAGNNTLIGTGATTTADYAGASSAVTVDLGTGVASSNGYGGSDSLTGISTVLADGTGDTLIGGSGSSILVEGGSGDLLEAGSGATMLEALGGGNTLVGGSGSDTFMVSGGGNTLIGGTGTTVLDYTGVGSAVTVDLATGVASSSAFTGNDTLTDIGTVLAAGTGDTLLGGSGADTLIESGTGDLLEAGSGGAVLEAASGGNTLLGAAGNDSFLVSGGGNTIDGGTGSNTVDYSAAGAAVTVNLATGTASSASFAGNDTLSNIETVIASGDDNILVGGAGPTSLTIVEGDDSTLIAGSGPAVLEANGAANVLVGGTGADTLTVTGTDDTLIAGSGSETLTGSFNRSTVLSFASSIAGVVVDLSAGTANGTAIGSDILANIADVVGSNFNDTLIGDKGDDTFVIGAGADTVVGNASGLTTVSYADATAGVTVDLATGTAVGSSILGDALTNVEAVTGSDYNDTLIAGSGNEILDGGDGGNDMLISGAGDDTLIGSTTGDNTVSYANASTGVLVDLLQGTATSSDGSKTDQLSNIQNVIGSASGDDTIIGSAGLETFVGGSGNEDFIAGTGTDSFVGGSGNNTVSFENLKVGIVADLNTGAATGATGEQYFFTNIENLTGGAGPDTLIGDSGDNVLQGGSGVSTLIGAGGDNTLTGYGGNAAADYAGAGTGVFVDLSQGEAFNNGYGGSDVLNGISNVIGSAFDDTLGGDGGLTSGSNILEGGAGDDTLSAVGWGFFYEWNGVVTLIGGAGNNTLIGTNAQATADYAGAPSAVTVNLSAGVASNGYGGTDTLTDISRVIATGSGNTLIGDAGADTFVVSGGDNTLIGGSGPATVDYSEATSAVTVNLSSGTATSAAFAGNDTLSNISGVIAAGMDDTLIGGVGAETLIENGSHDLLEAGSGSTVLQATGGGNTLVGGAGSDTFMLAGGGNTIEAGTGTNIVDYYYATSGVTVDLSSGVAASSGFFGSDTLSGISEVIGSGSNDTLIGSSSGDVLVGGGGDDTLIGAGESNTLDGTGGTATADYAEAVGPVVADLSQGLASNNGYGGTDLLRNISNLTGSAHGDTLIGDGGATSGSNTLDGGAGNDTLIAMGSGSLTVSYGTVTLIGGAGINTLIGTGTTTTADYAAAAGPVEADLSMGLASSNGYGSADALIGVSDLIGSAYGDTLIGDGGSATGSNILDGGAGNDTLIAVGSGSLAVCGGMVTLIGGAGSNVLVGTGAATAADYVGATSSVVVDLRAGMASRNGYGGSDTLVGISTALAAGTGDTLIGGAGNSTLIENGTDDLLEGGSGSTVMDALSGSDTLLGGTGSSTFVLGSSGGDTLIGGSGAAIADYTNAGNGVTVDLSSGFASGFYFSGQDTLTGITGAVAAGNNDVLIGTGDPDTLVQSGGFGSTLIAGSGNSTLSSSGADDTLNGGTGDDLLVANGNHDTLIGGSGVDTLASNVSGNTLIAGTGKAVAFYGDQLTDMVIDLAMGTAVDEDTGTSDQLIGITDLELAGGGNTVAAGAGSETLLSTGSDNTLIAGTGADLLWSDGDGTDFLIGNIAGSTLVASANAAFDITYYAGDDLVVDLSTGSVSAPGATADDTLVGIIDVWVSGNNDTLIAGSGDDTLNDVSGSGDILIGGSGTDTLLVGNVNGNTLIAGTGPTVAFYTGDDVTISLASDVVTASSGSDTLLGITIAAGFGSNDTLIGGATADTLMSDGDGNTLIAGTGPTEAMYTDGTTIDLSAGTATGSGASASDTLIGITDVVLTGVDNTVTAGSGTDTLTSTIGNNVLISGSGADSLFSSGSFDTLIGGSGADTLYSSGADNTLIAGAGTKLLLSSGQDDTLASDAGGHTLEATSGASQTTAYYSADDLTVDLSAGTVKVNGASSSDALVGISIVESAGTGGTLIGGIGTDTLMSDVGGNTLISGTGLTVAGYKSDYAVVDLAAGTATESGHSDTLIGISNVAVSGFADTVFASTGTDTISASFAFDTLIASSGTHTLLAEGAAEYLYGGSGTDTLISTDGDNRLIAGTGTETLISTGDDDTLAAGAGTNTLMANDAGELDPGILYYYGDFYDYALGDGNTTIVNGQSSNSGPTSELNMGTGISANQIWLERSGNDLQIDLLGTTSEITVSGWFSSVGNQLQEITADGLKLDGQVSQLAQAMATYSTNNPSFDPKTATSMPTDSNLQNAIATAWHH